MGSGAGPLVGRAEEIAHLTALVNAAAAGVGGTAVVVGEPGAGKSRLVTEIVAVGAAAGVSVRTGRALDHEVERVLGAALDAFGLRLDQLVGPEAATRIVLAAGAGAGGARFLVADRLIEQVEACCALGPLLLVVEDLHWADTATLAWLRAVVERAAALPLAVVVTTRPPPPGSPLARSVHALDEIRLGPLAPADVDALAVGVLGRAPGAELAVDLGRAEGNPLLVLSVLDAATRGTSAGPLAARLGELGEGPSSTLLTAAVLGATVVPADVAAVAAVQLPHVLDHLDAAVAAGFLVPQGHAYAFRHELHRAAVLGTLSAAARATHHLAAARVLAGTGAPALDVAEHFARGARPGDREAVDWLRRAALDMVASAPAGALRLVDVAVSLSEDDPTTELLLVRVRALAGVGRSAEAETLGRALLRDGMAPAAEAALRRELAFAAMVDGRAADSVTEMEQCEALTADPSARARVEGEIAFARFLAVDHAGAASTARQAIADGRRSGDVAAQVAGGAVLCFLDLFALRVPDARAHAATILRLAELPGAAEAHVFQPWFIAALVRLETDDLVALRAEAQRGRQVATTRGAGWAVPGYDAVAAFGALRAGDLDDVVATADAVLGYLDGVDGLGVSVWCHAFRAQVHLHRGDDDAAEADLDAAERVLDTGRAQLGYEQVQLARAAWHERRGRPDLALAALVPVWDLFTALGMRSPLPAVGAALGRLASTSGDRARARDVAAALARDASASGIASLHCIAELIAAWHDGDPDRALGAATAAARTPRRPLAARAFGDAAALLRARGRRAEADLVAGEATRRWADLHAPAEAAACAVLSRTARAPLARPRFGVEALTPTERHVVGLVADGLANADIAARLCVSRRTVESHVGASYRKLGVDSRVALARTALRHGIAVGA